MSRFRLAAVLCALIAVSACGGSGGEDAATTTIAAGPLTIALPFLPEAAGENLTVGLRNLTTMDATVTVTAFLPAGGTYPPGATTLTIPAGGGIRTPLAFFTGSIVIGGGWLHVDTRDVTTLDAEGEPTATATSGFVAAYMQRSRVGREEDGALGAAFRDAFTFVSVIPTTLAVQVINTSYDPMAAGSVPTAVSVDITEYDAFGVPTLPTSVVVPANGSILVAPLTSTGRIEVVPTPPPGQPAPATTMFRIATAALEADPQVFIEARLADIPRPAGQRFVGFDLEFGVDFVGNEYDFEVVATNASDGGVDETVVLEGIFRSNGSPILASPRLIGLDDKRTKLLRTTTRDSQGLDNTEQSPFDDIFGDVALATSLETFTVVFSVPAGVDISARAFNAFKAFYRTLPGRKLTTDVVVCGVEVPTRVGTGVTNLVSLMNPRNVPLQVNIRGATPGGTIYFLDPVIVNPFSRFDWSPDGLIFTEDPSDINEPPVPFMSFRFTGQGGMFFNARRDRRDVQDLIISIVPHPVRDLSAD